MGRPPCCDKSNVKRGLWTEEEDLKLIAYTNTHGVGNWTAVPKKAGLKRCGKSCRLRWTNYLRPNLKHESFTPQEEEMIINLHATIGSRWSVIANYLPGRTDNDIKNHWNTKLSKKLYQQGIDPVTHKPVSEIMEHISCLTNTQNQYQTAPESCITNLNRDLNSVFLAKPGPVMNPGFYEASSCVEIMPFTFTNGGMSVSVEGSASSTTPTAYPSYHQETSIQQSNDLKWSDFLVDDVFLSCIQDDNAGSIDQLSTNSKGNVTQNSKEKLKFEDTILEEEVSSLFQAQASSSSSFIDSILDQGINMMEFPEFLNDHDGLI